MANANKYKCSATFLESYVSSALSLLIGQGQPNHTYLLISTSPIMVLYAIAYRYFYKIPNVAGLCWYNQNQSIRANVELKYCAMVTNVKFSAAVALWALLPVLSFVHRHGHTTGLK